MYVYIYIYIYTHICEYTHISYPHYFASSPIPTCPASLPLRSPWLRPAPRSGTAANSIVITIPHYCYYYIYYIHLYFSFLLLLLITDNIIIKPHAIAPHGGPASRAPPETRHISVCLSKAPKGNGVGAAGSKNWVWF